MNALPLTVVKENGCNKQETNCLLFFVLVLINFTRRHMDVRDSSGKFSCQRKFCVLLRTYIFPSTGRKLTIRKNYSYGRRSQRNFENNEANCGKLLNAAEILASYLPVFVWQCFSAASYLAKLRMITIKRNVHVPFCFYYMTEVDLGF